MLTNGLQLRSKMNTGSKRLTVVGKQNIEIDTNMPPVIREEYSATVIPGGYEFCLGKTDCDCEDGYVSNELVEFEDNRDIQLRINGELQPQADGMNLAEYVRRFDGTGGVNTAKLKYGALYEMATPCLLNVSDGPVHLSIKAFRRGDVLNPLGWTIFDKTLCKVDCDPKPFAVMENVFIDVDEND